MVLRHAAVIVGGDSCLWPPKRQTSAAQVASGTDNGHAEAGFKVPDGRVAIAPVHAGETIGTGLLAKILQDCDLTREKLNDLS